MTKKANKVYLSLILLLAFFVLNAVFPQFWNRAVDLIKPELSYIPLLRALPRLPERDFKLGLDLQGGSRLVYQADLSQIEQAEKGEAMQGLRDVIERRVNLFGVSEPVVASQRSGANHRLMVELAGVHDVNEAIEMIGKTPFLEFKEERPKEEAEKIIKENAPAQDLPADVELTALCSNGDFINSFFQVYQIDPCYQPTGLTGQYLKRAGLNFGQTTFEPEIVLEFDKEGTELFKQLTEKNIGKRLAIFLDNLFRQAPVVQEAIPSGTAKITGTFTLEEAKQAVRDLNAGALPVPIELISQNTIGPSLGRVSLEKSLQAAVLGFLAVILFMVVFYRFSGLLASFSLALYVLILLALFKFIPVTLTLAGIGGAILSMGMAVDANVLIFERYKEERAKGETFQKAVAEGFSKAWPSIRDGNLTTILVGAIMFSFGTSFVKGFALTLSLGILVSMFSALVVTRILMTAFVGTALERIKWPWQ